MALTTRLEMRQGQQLVMTPQLQQAIKLLQYSNLELTQFVEGELERNPLLEREEGAVVQAAARGRDRGRATPITTCCRRLICRARTARASPRRSTPIMTTSIPTTPAPTCHRGPGAATSGWESVRPIDLEQL